MSANFDSVEYVLHELPNCSVWYGDHNHSYWAHNPDTGKKGRRMTGMSTIAKVFDKGGDNLTDWAARRTGAGVAEVYAMQGDGDWLESQESIMDTLTFYRRGHIADRDLAADRGTAVHLVLESLAKGEDYDLTALSNEARGHAEGVIAFWEDYNPTPLAIEQVVADPDLFVAGRCDLIARLEHDDGLYVLDLKTSKRVYTSAHLQMAGYRYLAESCGVVDGLSGSIVLHTHPDGTYTLVDGQATDEDFKLAVSTYRASGRVDSAARRAGDRHTMELIERG